MSLRTEFFYRFTLSVLRTLKSTEHVISTRQVINSDLIPSISEDYFKERNLIEKTIFMEPSLLHSEPDVPDAPKEKVSDSGLSQSIEHPTLLSPPELELPARKIPILLKPLKPEPHSVLPRKVEIAPPNYTAPSGEFGRITPLLKDPTVVIIDCSGPDKPVFIIRNGQRQITKISLSPNELEEILKTVSQKAHIPVMEGVFRAAVDNFHISAVVSSSIGSRFIIKKQTPYALLDNHLNMSNLGNFNG